MPTPPTNPPGNTLAAIQQKVRRLTYSPSENQLTTDDLNNYINTFILYDFPEHLRTFNFKTTFNFYTNPYQDVYPTDILSFGTASQAKQNPLYNFQNRYLTIHPPAFIAGFDSLYTQSREQFYGIYPIVNNIQSIGVTGDGVTTTFSGVIPIMSQGINIATQNGGACLVKNNVTFASVDINNNGLTLIDVPVLDSVTGNPTVWGNLYVPGTQPGYNPPPIVPPAPLPIATAPYPLVAGGSPNANNYINYVTGAFTITFPFPPKEGQIINSETVPQIVSLPQAICYYNNQFIIRPVPDQPYQINMEAYIRPTQLFQADSVPQLEEYWQYISYGAAKKIFEDKMDLDSVQLIMPEFKLQERLCLRRSLVQNTNERTATIYTEQTSLSGHHGGWGWGGGGNF